MLLFGAKTANMAQTRVKSEQESDKRGRKKIATPVRKIRKKIRDRRRSTQTVYVGREVGRWRTLKAELGLTYEAMAKLLLDT